MFGDGPQHLALGLGDDARPPHRRDRRRALPLHRRRRVRAHARRRRAARDGPRCTAISTARRAPRSRRSWRPGRDILFDIDYQGTLQLYEKSRADMVTIFILPPSIKELRKRLERRAAGQQGHHRERLKNARIEMEHWREYDYVIVNEDLEELRRRRCARSSPARALARDRATRRWSSFVRRPAEPDRLALAATGPLAPSPSARNASTGRSSARSSPLRPAAASSASTGTPVDLRLCRTILRRWPKAARVTASRSRDAHVAGRPASARGAPPPRSPWAAA